jgi:beta-lactam-binding protein with PASTA domain
MCGIGRQEAPMSTLEAGLVVASRYVLETRLDSGGRAEVWRANDTELERPVAVKLLRPSAEGGAQALEEFHAEAQAEAALRHPNIVEVFDWGHEGDMVYVVMELVEGATVTQSLETTGRLRWETALSVGRQVSSALSYAHQEGVAHGTISTDRILLGADGRVTLIGFGLRCRGGVCETPPSPDADTYALGGVLYEMLTGFSPFGAPPPDQPEQVGWPRPVHQIAHDCPSELSRIVMRAIAPDASHRYTTAAELHADLDAFARPKSLVWLWVLLAVLAIAGVAAGTWYFSSQQKVDVPYIVGRTPAEATTILQGAGLKLVVSGQSASSEVATGTIVSASPAGGQPVRKGADVAVVVSAGLPTVSVPSVVGADLQTASRQISAVGLHVGTVNRQNSTTIPADAVMSTDPSSGVQVTVGAAVNLVVSAGQVTVVVPDVRGAKQSDATSRLTAAGLVPQVGQTYSSQPAGRVISQGPAPGSVVAQGSMVTLSVSRGPAPVIVPNVVGALTSDAKTKLANVGLVPIVSIEASGTTPSGKTKGTVHTMSPGAGDSVSAGSQVTLSIYN